MTAQDTRRLRDAIQRLSMAAAGAAEKRYRAAEGHLAPTVGSTRFRPRHRAIYEGFLAEEEEKRRPEKDRLQRKLDRLHGRATRRPAAPVAAVAAPCDQSRMDAGEFEKILDELGWKQADLARRLSEASGQTVAPRVVNRWARGTARVHPGVAAYLRLALKIHRSQISL